MSAIGGNLLRRVVVTGGAGFVGKGLVTQLQEQGTEVVCLGRSKPSSIGVQFHYFDLSRGGELEPLGPIDVVFHLAARVHVMGERKEVAAARHDDVNHLGMRRLLKALPPKSVSRVIYLSSIKVNGEGGAGQIYTERSTTAPTDPYGESKLAAERALFEWSSANNVPVTVFRPPLVYGEGVRANFLSLMKLVAKGIPLPFGSLCNIRSMIFRENLVDAMVYAATKRITANKVYMCSDRDDHSVRELIETIADAMHIKPRLVSVPIWTLRALGNLVGKGNEIKRLIEPLMVDSGKYVEETGWEPPYSFHEGIRRTVEAWITRPW